MITGQDFFEWNEKLYHDYEEDEEIGITKATSDTMTTYTPEQKNKGASIMIGDKDLSEV